MAKNPVDLKSVGVKDEGFATLGERDAGDELREAKKDFDSGVTKIRDGVGRAKEAFGEGFDSAKAKAKEAADQTQAKVREGYDQARHGAERARDTAQERYSELSGQVREGYVKARKDLDGVAGNVNDYVRDNPGKSVIIGAALGFFAGLLMSGGRRDS